MKIVNPRYNTTAQEYPYHDSHALLNVLEISSWEADAGINHIRVGVLCLRHAADKARHDLWEMRFPNTLNKTQSPIHNSIIISEILS